MCRKKEVLLVFWDRKRLHSVVVDGHDCYDIIIAYRRTLGALRYIDSSHSFVT